MNLRTLTLLIFLLTIFNSNTVVAAEEATTMHGAPEPKIHFQKGESHSGNSGPTSSGSPLLTFRNGRVLTTSRTMAIFWGSQWNNTSFASDKISGLDDFFNSFSGSQYASTANEYYDLTGNITSSSIYLGHTVDTSTPPSKALRVSQAVAEACKVTNNNPYADAVYFIYTSTGAGHVNYCAWHSWGYCSNGAPVQVAYMPNIDGIAGCDPEDSATGHSQGLSALANVTAHELMEGISDPRGTGWLDSSGYENADKCAWSFPISSANPNGLSVFTNGTQWKLQMEWSNAAYTAGTGLPNRSNQRACIY